MNTSKACAMPRTLSRVPHVRIASSAGARSRRRTCRERLQAVADAAHARIGAPKVRERAPAAIRLPGWGDLRRARCTCPRPCKPQVAHDA